MLSATVRCFWGSTINFKLHLMTKYNVQPYNIKTRANNTAEYYWPSMSNFTMYRQDIFVKQYHLHLALMKVLKEKFPIILTLWPLHSVIFTSYHLPAFDVTNVPISIKKYMIYCHVPKERRWCGLIPARQASMDQWLQPMQNHYHLCITNISFQLF